MASRATLRVVGPRFLTSIQRITRNQLSRHLSLFPRRSNTTKLVESTSAASNSDMNGHFEVPKALIAEGNPAIDTSLLVSPAGADHPRRKVRAYELITASVLAGLEGYYLEKRERILQGNPKRLRKGVVRDEFLWEWQIQVYKTKEYFVDIVGVMIAAKEGYPPGGAIQVKQMFQGMELRGYNRKHCPLKPVGERTHPQNADRIATAKRALPAALEEYSFACGIIEDPKKDISGSVPSANIALSFRAVRPMIQSKKPNSKTHKHATRSFSHSSSRFSETTPRSYKLVVKVDSTHPLAPFLGAFWDFVLQIEEFFWPEMFERFSAEECIKWAEKEYAGQVVPNHLFKPRLEMVMTNLKPQIKDRHLIEWEVVVVKSRKEGACACDATNKMLVVFTTEQIRISSDRVLAWSAAHEIAHLILRHGKKELLWYRWAEYAGLFLDRESIKFSGEFEADALGTLMTATAGYHPCGAIEALECIDKRRRLFKYKHQNPGERTHPDPKERIAAIQKLMPVAMERYRNTIAGNLGKE